MTPTVLLDDRGWLAERSQGRMQAGDVLLHAPSHVFQAPGGGENQLVQTGRALETIGVSARPFSPWIDSLADARLLHLFGMSREGIELARVARARGVPVVLSPICWYEPRAIVALSEGAVESAIGLAGWAVKRVFPRWPGWRRELLALTDRILPNSQAEAEQLLELFAVDDDAIRVIPNGVDPRFADACAESFHSRFGSSEFVLYVGRVEPRKNVLRLVEACRFAELPLVVIGDAPPGRNAYLRACRALGSGSAQWISALRHEDPLLASAYASARVFALPSWFETPGLSALEAALAGCAVVVTPLGCTREYFADLVDYARPDRPEELARALRQAWMKGRDATVALSRHVGSRFLWSEVARRTAEVYDEIAP